MFKSVIGLLLERRSFFLGLMLEHAAISFSALTIAIILGGLTGIFISTHKRTAGLTLNTVSFLYTIPSISMLGFLIPISGIGNTTAIIALTIYALLPMVRGTYTGLANIDERIPEASLDLGASKLRTLIQIRLPLAMPVIMSGIRNMAVMTIALAGIASFIGAGGLGVAIYRGITTNNNAMTIAGSALIAVMALAVDFVLGLAEKRKGLVKIIVPVILAGAGLAFIPSVSTNTINIATKPMTEQYILGEILKLKIEGSTNLKVNLVQGVGGGTANIHPAIISGKFDIYPEYTGTGWNAVLKREGIYTEDLFTELESGYKEMGLQWLGFYGFNNTYGLAVNRKTAEKYNLSKISDLRNVSRNLSFGAEYDFFEREDGYKALCESYGLNFASVMDLDIGLKYQALKQNRIDVLVVFTTDGQLSGGEIVVLEDDMHFYPSYMCANVARNETLERYPELRGIFEGLTGSISDSDMANMNYQVETLGLEASEVAKQFLLHNLERTPR